MHRQGSFHNPVLIAHCAIPARKPLNHWRLADRALKRNFRHMGSTNARALRPSLNRADAGPETGGMLPNGDCWPDNRFERRASYGDFGWPCAKGGSATVIETTADGHGALVNCFIFFLPAVRCTQPEYTHFVLGEVSTAIGLASLRQPRLQDASSNERVNLMDLALDIEEIYVHAALPEINFLTVWHTAVRTRVNMARLRGIVVIPGEMDSLAHGQGAHSQHYGLWTPLGALMFETVLVPAPFPFDLNADQLKLHIITVSPKVFM